MRAADETAVRLAVFEADITPPVGAPLCDALVPPVKEVTDRLRARGIVIVPAGPPIVLCALDWVGVGNGGYTAFREALAAAAGTTPDRVAVHSLHQHDAPGCDFTADDLLIPHGLGNRLFDVAFARHSISTLAAAVKGSLQKLQPVTHVGYGKGKVDQVASNRRVLGPDGKVRYVRYTATTDPVIRAEPEGIIDPYVHLLSFWKGDQPLASLTYYATHPQSYYGQGQVSCDFPGLARGLRDQELPGVFHVHFNGAGGNVTAGKYNDGAHENRLVLAQRLAAGMRQAFESTRKYPVRAADVNWQIQPVAMPPAAFLDSAALQRTIADEKADMRSRLQGARSLAWLMRCTAGEKIEISCLNLGPVAVLHMPGELFIEYQLAAQALRPGTPVLMAAYGDYGPGYIGLEHSYSQGGYETGPVSRVAPGVEAVLMDALRKLLK
ncbi:MAG: hypothetical protein JSS02_14670 [Planctomycetes bacterium]|nr:hypothetical protein [Planctomycetota bacterium]